MSKPQTPRPLAATEALATARGVKSSVEKAQLVLGLIRGKKVERALNDLTFSHKKLSDVAKKVLQSAIANAENNHNLSSAGLFVAEAHVDDGLIMKRFDPRARDSAHPIRRRTAHIRIQLSDKAPAPKKTKKSTNKVAKKEESK